MQKDKEEGVKRPERFPKTKEGSLSKIRMYVLRVPGICFSLGGQGKERNPE